MKNKKSFLKFILLLGDIFLMYFALLLTLGLRYKDFSFLPGPQTKIFLINFSFLHLAWLFLLSLLDFYEVPPLKKIFDFFYNLIVFSILAGAIGIAYFYLQPQLSIAPKRILFIDIFIFGLLVFLSRYLMRLFLKVLHFKEKIIILGFAEELQELFLKFIPQNHYEIAAIFETEKKAVTMSLLSFLKFGLVSDIAKLKKIIEREKIGSIVLASDIRQSNKLLQEIFATLPLTINYIPFNIFYEELTKKAPVGTINEAWFLENISRPEKKLEETIKRSFDIIFSIIGLLITVIIFPLVALSIKIDSPGSIFFTQKRIGREKKIFTIYKFRTMREIAKPDQELWREKKEGEVTKVGRILRKVHLDEFPQFWNILKGEMSFVGPRAEWEELVKIFEKEIPFYSQRFLVRPGFTGWAYINFPASTSVEEAKEKFKYDLYYIKNRSFFLDLSIILKTIKIVFR